MFKAGWLALLPGMNIAWTTQFIEVQITGVIDEQLFGPASLLGALG